MLSCYPQQKPFNDLRRTISQFLPLDFTRRNSTYEFDLIQTMQDAESLRRRRAANRVRESSYNFLKLIDPAAASLPVQIPTILQNAEYIKRTDDNFDRTCSTTSSRL